MGELLTTGQMIDQLRVGQIAVDKLGNEIFMEKDNSLRTLPNLEIVTLTDFTVLSKWRILPMPNYVSFEDAMKAYKENKKTITYHHDSDTIYTFVYENTPNQFERIYYDSISLPELLKGKWTIKE
ncbi:hypothetical protein M3E13_15560 [Oceanobacillus kimchii]|uniref:hypothetical protein n=1 Tax=Oceanobacillus kimchii TaxID=746691 RepID=UPI0021A7D078|nr:hypothetical protein [Oceanobacillus kimchii]MCT1575682.1 hypothetical protein [Oceanobacillus kimchii]MCT2137312.1 hypothetical protein [Oceanobacillus kimchii]